MTPLVVSWGYEAEVPGRSQFVDYFGWMGTMDYAPYLTVPTAIAFQQAHDWPRIRATCHALLVQAEERISTQTGLAPISPHTTDWWMQMRAIPLPPCDAAEVKRRLWDDHQVEVPLVVWQGYPFVRVSVQAYNSPRDVDRLIDGLHACGVL